MKVIRDNKTYLIPDESVKKYMDSLDITQEEAIELWLDDNGITVNDEQEELDGKAKTVKINHEAKAETKKEKKARPKKFNPAKQKIISIITTALKMETNTIQNLVVTNDEKYIDFEMEGVEYTVNLVAHRKKKGA